MPLVHREGRHVSYAQAGAGAGPGVLFIQGVGVAGRGWEPQVRALSDRYTCVSFDNEGIGESTRGSGALSIEGMAADAVAIMDAAGLDRAHIVGHSMGGVIAQALALSVPHRVASLTLMCTFSHGREATALSLSMLLLGLRTRLGSRRMRREAFLEVVMPAGVLAVSDRAALCRELATLFGHDLADQPPVVMPQLRAMSRYDARPHLARLASVPTLVMSAQYDRIAKPAYGRALAAAIPRARYVECEDAGHGLPIQRAAEVNALLDSHWSTGSPR